MSGGNFSHLHYSIGDLAEDVERLIGSNTTGYSPETLRELQRAATVLRQAAVYVRRIDWMESGDDSEDTFHQRLAEDLAAIPGLNDADKRA